MLKSDAISPAFHGVQARSLGCGGGPCGSGDDAEVPASRVPSATSRSSGEARPVDRTAVGVLVFRQIPDLYTHHLLLEERVPGTRTSLNAMECDKDTLADAHTRSTKFDVNGHS